MKSQGWGQKTGWKKHTALLLAVLMLMSTIPVFTYAEDIVGGEPGGGASSSGEAAPAEESKPEAEKPTESGESPSEERHRDGDDKGSTDEYSLTVTQEELFTEDGLAVEITAVSTFPFTRNLHIEAKDGGKAEGATEGDEKVTGDPEASNSEANSEADSSEASSETSSVESSVPEEPASSEEAGSDVSGVPEEPASSEESKQEENSKPDEEAPSSKPEEEKAPNSVSEFVEAAASARINLVRVLSADITADEIVPLPEGGKPQEKPESKSADDPAANTSTEEEKAPAPAESSSAPAVSSGEDASSDVSSDTGSDASQDNSTDSSSEPSSSDSSSSDTSSPEVSSTDETMSEGKVTVNEEGEPFRFQRKFTVTKNGTYVVRIYDDEGPLEERAFYTEVEVTSLGELTAEIVPGSYGQYEVEMASTYPETDRFVVEYIPAAQAMYRSRSVQPVENEPVEVPVEDVTVKTVDDGDEDKGEENAPSEVTEASAAVPASADGVYTVKAFRGENLLTTMSLDAPEALAAAGTLAEVYWNPTTSSSPDGSVTGGSLTGDGSKNSPVLTLQMALDLVMDGGTIYNVANWEIEQNSVSNSFDGKNARLVRYNHTSPIFTIGSGRVLSLSNITLDAGGVYSGSEAEKAALINLAGGTVAINAGVRMENEALIRFETTASSPVQLAAAPAEGTQYGLLLSDAFSSMDPVSVVTCTGIAGADALAHFGIENQGRGLRVKTGAANTIEAYDLPTYTGGVYLSGTGDDAKNGDTAANAVKTFHRAAEILKNSNLKGSGEIRITGSPVVISSTQTWSLPAAEYPSASLARNAGYTGDLIQIGTSGRTLTLENITLDGKNISATNMINLSNGNLVLGNGATLQNGKGIAVAVSGGSLTMNAGSKIASFVPDFGQGGINMTGGSFRMNGGAIQDISSYYYGVGIKGGTFTMTGGLISGNGTGVNTTSTTSGSTTTYGTFAMQGGSITGNTTGVSGSGKFELDGENATISDVISVGANAPIQLTKAPTTGKQFPIKSSVSQKSGQVMVTPGTGMTDVSGYAANFVSAEAGYVVGGLGKDLVLLAKAVYVDGQNGNNNNDGSTPTTAKKTVDGVDGAAAALRELVSADADSEPAIYVCDTVNVTSGTHTWDLSDLPGAIIRQYNGGSFSPAALIKTSGTGNLTIKGVVIDGGQNENCSIDALAEAAGGTLTLGSGVVLQRLYRRNSAVKISGGTLVLENGSVIGNASSNNTGNATERGNVWMTSGSFEMKEGAKISYNKVDNNDGAVKIEGGTFVMTGGEISNNSSDDCGGVYMTGGTFTMSGGVINGNTTYYDTSSAKGGGVYAQNASFIMTGGTISANQTAYGGGVYVDAGGTFELSGSAVIQDNVAKAGGKGVYVNGTRFAMGGGFTLGGNIVLAAADCPITLTDSLTGTGNHTLTVTDNLIGKTVVAGTAAVPAGQYLTSGKFVLDETSAVTVSLTISGNDILAGGKNVYWHPGITTGAHTGESPTDAVATLAEAKEKARQKGKDAIIFLCATYKSTGETLRMGEVTNGTDTWTPIIRRMSGFTGEMISYTGTLTLEDIILDGNKDAFTAMADPIVAAQNSNAIKLIIKKGAQIINNPGGGVDLWYGSFEMTDGKISGNVKTGSSSSVLNGRGISLRSSSSVTANISGGEISGNTNGVYVGGYTKLTVSGGKISGNGSAGSSINGPGIYVSLSSSSAKPEITISGNADISGNLSSGTTTNGAVYINSSLGDAAFNMTGGKISDNSLPGLYLSTKRACAMSGGTISGNKGSGVIISGSQTIFNMSAGTISNNTGASYGGGVYLNGSASGTSAFNMTGGTISNNTATSGGGGVAANYRPFTMSGSAAITGNKVTGTSSSYGGGGVYLYNGATAALNGGSISGSNQAKYGAGLYVYNGSATLGGTSITGNTTTATGYGGGAYIGSGSSLTINSGSISGNTATYSGGGVYVNSGVLTFNSGSISQNTANSSYGGGICVLGTSSKTAAVDLNGGSISENKAGASGSNNGGGMYIGNYSTVTLQGTGITGNRGRYGAGVYLTGANAQLTATRGRISGNTLYSGGQGAGIYVASPNFILQGGGADISDDIYLSGTSYPIKLHNSITQTSRQYEVSLATAFAAGNNVVESGGDYPSGGAWTALSHFYTNKTGAILGRSADDQIGVQTVIFLDGTKSASGDGSTPDKAFNNFAAASAKLEAAGSTAIYISGPVTVSGTESWTLPAGKSLRRYSGFSVAGKDEFAPYYGDMIVVPANAELNLDAITIEGRHSQDIGFTAAGSIIRVNGGTVNMNAGATLQNNTTSGNGGAVRVDGGTFNLNAGTIANTTAKLGGAVYQNGTFNVKSAATVSGGVYLGAGKTVGVSGSAGTRLSLDMDDAENARAVVTYTSAPTSANLSTELAKYTLSDDVAPLYKLARRTDDTKIFELQEKGGIYVDGNAAAGGDGTEPSKAVRTLQEAYQKLAGTGGGTIYVVNPVTVSGTIALGRSYAEGGTTVDAGGPVTIKRYSKPDAFTTQSNTDTLINVTGGTLTLAEGLTVDGHSAPVTQGKDTVRAPAVEAAAPLISVSGGTVLVQSGAVLRDNHNPSGNGGAVATSGSGTLTMTGGTIANMKASQGAAVYHSGTALNLSGGPSISGEVYLNGAGKVISVPGSTIGDAALTIGIDSASAEENRAVVTYSATPTAAVEMPKYTLSDAVSAAFYLSANGNSLVLTAKGAVYLNGSSGNDANTGASPAQAVRTLGMAYQQMNSNNANTLYIVADVTIDSAVELNGRYCYADGKTYDAGAPVTIRRYSKPTNPPTGFTVVSNTGLIFLIKEGGSLTLENITIDGHRRAITSGKPSVVAEGIAGAPAIRLEGGALFLNEGAVLQNNEGVLGGTQGAIYAYGRALGGEYTPTPASVVINGGKVTGNGGTSQFTTGGIAMSDNSSFKMTAGEICGNDGLYGAGIMLLRGAKAEITGGSIWGNMGTGLLVDGGEATLKNCVVADNAVELTYSLFSEMGGGIHIASGTVTAENLTLRGNTTEGGPAGIYQGGTLNLRGEATSFDADQTVYLKGDKTINVTGSLPSEACIPLDMDRDESIFKAGRAVVSFAEGVTTDAAGETGKFELARDINFALVTNASDKRILELGAKRSITAQPADTFVKLGDAASFTITTAGDTPTGYRIFNKTKKAYVGSEVKAVTSADDPNTVTVSFTPTLADGAGEYQVEAVYGTGASEETLRSDPAVLSLWELAYGEGRDALTTLPEVTAMVPNDAVSFTVHSGYDSAVKLQVGSYQYTADDGFDIGWAGSDYVTTQINRTTWGSTDAMSNIVFQYYEENSYVPISPETSHKSDVAAGGTHNFFINLYNGNAIAERHIGTLGMTLSLLDGGTEAEKSSSAAEVKFLMQPAAINATLPLAVQSYGYGADGSVAVPTNYGIQNGSNFPIKVTGLTAKAAADFRLMDPSSFVEGADRTYKVNKNQMSHGQATLRLNDRQITTAAAGGSWTAGADFTGWAIKGAASEGAWVSYPIAIESYIAKGEDSTTGKQLAEVTYTVGVSPESVS